MKLKEWTQPGLLIERHLDEPSRGSEAQRNTEGSRLEIVRGLLVSMVAVLPRVLPRVHLLEWWSRTMAPNMSCLQALVLERRPCADSGV